MRSGDSRSSSDLNFNFSIMNLYLEPLMTGLPKLSCYHRAYYDKDDNLIIDLGTKLFPKGPQEFSSEIITGTRGIRPEISFKIHEETRRVVETDKIELPKENVVYKVQNEEGLTLHRVRNSEYVTTNYATYQVKSGEMKSISRNDATKLISIKGRSTLVSDEDLNKLCLLILECFNWRTTHHVTQWR